MKKSLLLVAISLVLILSGCASKMDHSKMDKNHGDSGNMAGMDHNNMGGEKATEDSLQATWKLSVEKPKSNENDEISIQIQDKNGKAVKDFEVEHEKLMHLIVVSKDLSYFNHIHPEYKGDGLFTITTAFPTGGDYKLYADFVPKGGSKSVKTDMISVQGDTPKSAPLQPEANLTKVIDGKEVTLSFDQLKAAADVNLNFNIKDAQSKQPITNLQPYLGAVGHVVVISEDTNLYLHVHPTDEKASGPDAKFMTNFPKSGTYKVWGQFQHGGKVFTVPFTVKVP